MWDMFGAVFSIASFGLAIFLERKNIIAEYRQIREEMRIKAAYKQKAASESHAPQPVIVPKMKQYRDASKTFLSSVLGILKTFVAVIGSSFSFVFIAARFYIAFEIPTDIFFGIFYAVIFWGSMLVGLIYGVVVLRKKTWGFIFKFFGVAVLCYFILLVISVIVRS
jgi:hypothetical protein